MTGSEGAVHVPARAFQPAIAVALAVALPSAWSAADNCDALRDQIEGRIWATGVTAFSVSVVDAAASAPGRVVGTCAQGRRKIVYLRLQPDGAAAAAPARTAAKPTSRAASATVITECKDGSVSVGGDCKK